MSHPLAKAVLALLLALLPTAAFASANTERFDLTASWVGYTALAVFALAYALVMAEEFTHLRKSKPVVLAAGIIWLVIAYYYTSHHGDYHTVENAVHHNIMEFAELFLFLLAAMTYINAMEERRVFEWLRAWLVRSSYSYRKLFWLTGFLAFFISPVADNLTTALLMCAVVMAVGAHNFFHLPPVLGMMTGLAYLKFFGYYLSRTNERSTVKVGSVEDSMPFDIFQKVARAEWDTLLFFYGVILCVGGLGFIGYLELVSLFAYGDVGPTFANTMVGFLSAIVDNIPVMFAVLTMNPEMPQGQWLLVTLTAGVGGSLLSIGSAAGVALMGQAKGLYTFFEHMRWTKYIASATWRAS